MDTRYGNEPAGGAAPPAEPVVADEPVILEEIEVEDLAVDGICGVY